MIAHATPVILFFAFGLLFLVSLGVPIIKDFYIVHLTTDTASQSQELVRFGPWGFCLPDSVSSVAGQAASTALHCSQKKVGYVLDNSVNAALPVSNAEQIISKALTGALVLHPVACGLTFIAFLISLTFVCSMSRAGSIISAIFVLVTAAIAAIITSITFIYDLIFAAVVKRDISKASGNPDNLEKKYGPAFYMVMAATILLWVSCIGACCGAGRRGRKGTR